jgi:PEP-CTERM motif-containing protein
MKNLPSVSLLAVAILAFAAIPGWTSVIDPCSANPCTITIDENGNGSWNGTPLSFALGTDPGPGGQSGVLIYSGLPVGGAIGDVLLNDNEGVSDILRFNGNGTVIVYSDITGGSDALADNSGLTSLLNDQTLYYGNLLFIDELGPEGNNGAIYTPSLGQPGSGFNPLDNVTYNFISDSTPVPEPGSMLLFASGLMGLAGTIRRKLLP